MGKSLALGNEGAGVVVDAGSNARHLIGKVVSAAGGRMYTHYRKVRASDVLPLPGGVSPKEGASAFINPMTALGMLSTMRLEGHTALVHTAAASNLG
jgi:NADPH:quinone reductase-like Zn-dependent oxidoreductase